MKTCEKLYMNITFTFFLLLAFNFSIAQNTISGTITTELGEPLVNVVVSMSGTINENVLTDENGYYEFNPPQGGNYLITPSSNTDPLNGVSSLDVVMISDHINGDSLLDSPYKIIAADVNFSGSVSTIDIVTTNQLISGTILEFPNNDSWRFIEAGFVFPNPLNPFETAVPSIVSVNSLEGDVTFNFIGIKIGDVNNTAFTTLSINPCDLSCGSLSGNVYYDLNQNCFFDNGEIDLKNWIITATSGSETIHASSNQFGMYVMDLLPGDYTVTITPPNNLWFPCQASQDITVGDQEDINLDFPAQAFSECPALEVDLGTPFIRRCFDGIYGIQYCNQGTGIATDVYLEVTFDSFLVITNSSIPWELPQSGNTYTFNIGDVAVGGCDGFIVDFMADCDATLGQTFCSEAHIYPDTLCVPPSDQWDGSSVDLFGYCDGDSVRFEIKNIGDPMSQPVNYIVIEDDMIMMIDEPVQLDAAESKWVTFPANGSTWRLEIEQSPNHPNNEILSITTEGCGVNGNGEFSLGFVTLFPQFAESNAVDIDCVEAIGSWDPNDKQAIPKGAKEEHYIERNTDLEYRIRFQNTGTDTAFTVIIRDTLSEWLDVLSVRPGVSSHDYQFSLSEENIIEFRFDNIMLPDSNVNEPASHGFVKFTISQLPDNALGTVIKNKAAIYFDYNEPVITNQVFHTIGENFLEIVDNILEPGQHFSIKLYPNLIRKSAILQLEGVELREGTFILYDLFGRIQHSQEFTGNSFEFYKSRLGSGLYMFEIREQGKRLSTGKLMIQD